MLKVLPKILILVAFSFLVYSGIAYRELIKAQGSRSEMIQTLEEASGLINAYGFHPDENETEVGKMKERALFGLSHIDPHSFYQAPVASEKFKKSMSGQVSTAGIGILFGRDDREKVVVKRVYDGSPAQKSGLLMGSEIIAIDGNEINELSIKKIAQRFRGPLNTSVKIDVTFPGSSEIKEVKIIRAFYKLASVEKMTRLQGVPYIRLNKFTSRTHDELRLVLDDLQKEFTDSKDEASIDIQPVIIDLRNNGGGDLESTLAICDDFVAPGKLMFSTRKRTHSKKHFAKESQRYHNFRFIILTDRNSASASEVLSAFLRDYDLALLFGEKSFGKGSMQQVLKLSDDGTLRLTVAHWVSPGEYVIHGKGLPPDYAVNLAARELPFWRDYLTLDQAENYDKQLQASLNFIAFLEKGNQKNSLKERLLAWKENLKENQVEAKQ